MPSLDHVCFMVGSRVSHVTMKQTETGKCATRTWGTQHESGRHSYTKKVKVRERKELDVDV